MLFSAAACGKKTSVQVPAPAKIGDTETGIASWYGAPYNGRRAASGEIYDMEQMTAAHRTLAFGTWLEVSDLDNGKQVEVRITDRGPFVKGRVIDLSLAAARKIEMVGPGIAHVRLRRESISASSTRTSSLPARNAERRRSEAGEQISHGRSRTITRSKPVHSRPGPARSRLEETLRDQFEDSRVVEGLHSLASTGRPRHDSRWR